ncbi:MAG: alpha/beta hydrolase [Candidatus Omnitrophica bacterium]|nr:alpha/beta hydrolase [Candidatus Omnitrophota bacterium]
MSYIKTQSGINWHYETEGQNEAILFIHGWSFDASVWCKQIDIFSHHYRVIVLDLPGHGHSDYKKDIDIIEDLNFIAKKLGLGSLNLVGHSLGGFFSLKFAVKYPELVKRLILIGATAKFVKSQGHNQGLEESEISKLRGFLTEDYPDILLVFIRWLFTKQERKQRDFRQIWNVLIKRSAWPKKEAMSEFLSVIEKEDLRKELKKLNTPTLIISGTNDPICPITSIDYLSRQIKGSKTEFFEHCGHLPFLTQPQRFNRLVKEFLEISEKVQLHEKSL